MLAACWQQRIHDVNTIVAIVCAPCGVWVQAGRSSIEFHTHSSMTRGAVFLSLREGSSGKPSHCHSAIVTTFSRVTF